MTVAEATPLVSSEEIARVNEFSGMRVIPGDYDPDAAPERQAEEGKPAKVLPCRGCKRPLIVSAFYAPHSAATCSGCRGGGSDVSAIAAPVPGKSDPARVKDLSSVLINKGFAQALCPVHPDDPEHEMELKHVSHSEHHGPSEIIGYDSKGMPEFRQLAPGEHVLHQCQKCRATVSYSTTAQTQFLRQNEVLTNKHVNGIGALLGSREEKAS